MNLYRGNLYRGSSIQKDVTPHSLSLSNCVATIMRGTRPHTHTKSKQLPLSRVPQVVTTVSIVKHARIKLWCDLLPRRKGRSKPAPSTREFLSRSNCLPRKQRCWTGLSGRILRHQRSRLGYGAHNVTVGLNDAGPALIRTAPCTSMLFQALIARENRPARRHLRRPS